MTTDESLNENVEGYNIVEDCVWPLLLQAIDNQMSFAINHSNLTLFKLNFVIAKDFTARLKKLVSDAQCKSLLDKFNLQTYADLVVLELSDK